MAPTTIAINGVPVETLGLTPSNLSGWLDGPAYGYQTSEVIGRYGQAVTGVNVTANPKVLKFTGYLQPASLAARRTALDALSKALTGRLEITTTDDPTRALYAYLTAMPVRTVGPALLSGQPQAFVDVTLTAFDPLWYDLTPQVMAIAAASTPAAFSTAGTAPLLRILAPEGELLIPFAEEICRQVDLEKKQIRVRLPEGLRELNRRR